MRIAMILPSLAKRGPVLVAKDIVDSLIARERVERIDIFYFDDVVEVKFPCRCTKIELFEKVDFSGYDVVHSHQLRPDIFLFLNVLQRRISRKKTVTTLHQYDYPSLKNDLGGRVKGILGALLWRLVLSTQGKVICLSQHMMEYYRYRIFNRNIHFAHNGRSFPETVQDSDFPEALSVCKGTRLVGTVCLLSKIKGLEQVIKVLPMLKDVSFVIMGEGPEEASLKSLAQELGVVERCVFLGFIREPDKYLPFLDCFILPSRSEGFALALLEAASLGVSSVCSRIPVFEEVFDETEVSFFTLDDLASLRDAIESALEKKSFFGRNILRKFQSSLTADAMADRYLELYKSS